MKRIILSDGQELAEGAIDRRTAFDAGALEVATKLIERVRRGGDEALREITAELDGVNVTDFAVTAVARQEALERISGSLREALSHAARQIRQFHERQKAQSWFFAREDGALLGAKITPLDSVGIYVPGGRALYPSTVLMNALPAAVAGVKRIVCVTPPTKSGAIDDAVLAACELSGVTEIYTVGGAQAIAALAYGTQTIAPVDKITGPGNAFVAAAKKLVSGDVGIDMIAGPSEVCVVADESVNPKLVALDLMAQAEHDPQAGCYLVCFSEQTADAVEEALRSLIAQSPREEITATALEDRGLIVVCANMDQAIDAVNLIAPEHLELQIPQAMELIGRIRHAGAIFLGPWTPEAVGDYVAGPNHTLPTGGTARYASPLSVDDYVKRSSIISFTPAALLKDGPAIEALAAQEGLWAHGQSVSARLAALDEIVERGVVGSDAASLSSKD